MKNQALIIDGEVQVDVRATIKLTGGQLAALFWHLETDEQVEFFTELGALDPYRFSMQMLSVAGKLEDPGGLGSMRAIGESYFLADGWSDNGGTP
jgi:hypothetical protein